MPLYRVRLTWGNPPDPAGARWRLGLFLVTRRRTLGWQTLAREGNRRTFLLSLRGLFLWSLPLALAGYFVAAAALLHWYQRNPYNQISYVDLILPTRWTQLPLLRGKTLIAEARDDLESGRLQAGFGKLRTGLARDPANSEARVLLAEWCSLFRLRALSYRTLLDGCPHGYREAGQLRRALALFNDADSPKLVLDFIARARAGLLALGETRDDLQRVLDEQEMRTLLAQERSGEALKLVRERRPAETAWLREAELADALARKDYPAAVAIVKKSTASASVDDELRRSAVRVFREAGQLAEMQAALRASRTLHPTNPGVVGFAVQQNLLAAQDMGALAALEDYFFRFGADAGSLNLLANAIAQTGRDDFLARIEDHARAHGFNPLPILQARALAQAANLDWTAARRTLLEIQTHKNALHKTAQVWLETSLALVDACLDEGSGVQARLVDLVSRHPGNLKLYRTHIDALRSAGRLDTAATLLTLAEGAYPESDYVASARRDVLAEIDKRNAASAAALAARQPEPPTRRPKTLPELFAALDALAVAKQPDEALRLIANLRRNAPEVLHADKTGDIARRELDLCLQTRDLPLLQLTLRAFLKGPPDRAPVALKLAKTCFARDEQDVARLIVREILRHQPENSEAMNTLVSWEPKPAKTPESPAAADDVQIQASR